ncbi:MAG: YezD family protein [Candidatus Binatia bacterium]
MGHAETTPGVVTAELEHQILQAIKTVRYGSVEIIIHDSQVVQIERKEKLRFARDKAANRK